MGESCGVVADMLYCDLEVCVFDLQSRYYVHFRIITPGKFMIPVIIIVIGQLLRLLSFYKNGSRIK